MSIHVVGIIGLVFVFVVGTTRSVNLGAVALVMTFIVGSIFEGESLDDMYSGLPADLFVPWVILLVSALPTMAGALGPVRVALLAPIALRLSGRYDLDRRLVALMCMVVSAPIATFLVFIAPVS